MILCKVSPRTAKRRISDAFEAGIILKDENGLYYYPREVYVEVEDIEPLAEEEPSSTEERPEFGKGECPY